MSKFYKVATVKGVGSGASFSFSGIAAVLQPMSAGFTHNRKIDRLLDSDNRLQGFAKEEEADETLDVELVIRATATDVSLNCLMNPPDLCEVTLASFHAPGAARPGTETIGGSAVALFNGSWIYETGWKVTLSPDAAEVKISCTLTRRIGCAYSNATLLTAVPATAS